MNIERFREQHLTARTPTDLRKLVNVAVEAGVYGRDEAGQGREKVFGGLEERWPDLRGNY